MRHGTSLWCLWSFAVLLLGAFAALPGLAVASSPAASTVRISGWLHTRGTEILDGENRVVVFRGVNVSGMEWGTGHRWTKQGCHGRHGCWSSPVPSEFQKLSDWGFTMIRLPIAWADLEPDATTPGPDGTLVHHYNEEYLSAVDDIVAQCRRHHLAVVFSMHQWGWSPVFQRSTGDGRLIHGNGLPEWLYPHADSTRAGEVSQAKFDFFSDKTGVQAGFVAVWRTVARRYANEPAVVGVDLINEPNLKDCSGHCGVYGHPDVPLEAFYDKVGRAIREENPHLLLVMEQGPGTLLTALPNLPNLVLSFHTYPKNWDPMGKKEVTRHWERAQKWQVPLWIGEFQSIGKKKQPEGPDGWKAQTAGLLRYCKEHSIGWAYWAYQRCDRPIGGSGGTGPVNQPLVKVLQAGL